MAANVDSAPERMLTLRHHYCCSSELCKAAFKLSGSISALLTTACPTELDFCAQMAAFQDGKMLKMRDSMGMLLCKVGKISALAPSRARARLAEQNTDGEQQIGYCLTKMELASFWEHAM